MCILGQHSMAPPTMATPAPLLWWCGTSMTSRSSSSVKSS